MSMKYISMELGPIMTNCYIVYDTDTKDAMVVDPAWDYPAIDKALTSHGLTLKFIFLTHGHADHIGALQELLSQVRGSAVLPRREIPADAVPISSNDLMRLLSHLQQHFPVGGQQVSDDYDLRNQLEGLLGTMDQHRKQRDEREQEVADRKSVV